MRFGTQSGRASQSAHRAYQRRDLPSLGDRVCRVAAVLERVCVTPGCTGRTPFGPYSVAGEKVAPTSCKGRLMSLRARVHATNVRQRWLRAPELNLPALADYGASDGSLR